MQSSALAGTLTYAVTRLLVAVGLAAALWLTGRRGWSWIGQAVSDVACVTFVVGYADGAVRATLGWLAAPLLLYVLVWEVLAVASATREAQARLTANEMESPVHAIAGTWRWAWAVLCVAPPVAAGGFLVFDIYAPNEWPFPGRVMGSTFACAPDTARARDTVVLTMQGGHGAEFGVFVPGGAYLYLMMPAGREDVLRIRRLDRVVLNVARTRGALQLGGRTQPVFARPGAYTFMWSDATGIDAALRCTVQYAP